MDKKIDQEINKAIQELIQYVVPQGIGPQTRKHLAKKGGLSEETLRTINRRKKLNVDTLFRILYARGIPLQKLVKSIKTKRFSMLLEREAKLIKFCMRMSEKNQKHSLELLEFIHDRWK